MLRQVIDETEQGYVVVKCERCGMDGGMVLVVLFPHVEGLASCLDAGRMPQAAGPPHHQGPCLHV